MPRSRADARSPAKKETKGKVEKKETKGKVEKETKSKVEKTDAIAATATGKAIKRPTNAYMHWLKENRARIAAADSEMKPTQVVKAAGAEWRATTDRAKWEKAAAADKERYNKELKALTVTTRKK